MQAYSLNVAVSSKTHLPPEKIAEIIQKLIDIGIADANATLEDKEGDIEGAEIVSQLDITVGTKLPRVLVTVDGGVAEAVYDPGVDVEIFDRDNYKAGEDLSVSAHFEDLARDLDIPVRQN